ncbi:MAG: flippase-like domain-containing protein [Deltaproteobacteria bacterium]|nr:flippase-like domain-containing protein [Deltaproteobacteria bacterium]
MQRLLKRLLIGIALGVGVYAIGTIYVGLDQLASSLASFSFWLIGPVLALTLFNYGVRFAKWQIYLRTLSIEVPTKESMLIFLSGLSMVVTPGKIGELLKSYLLKTSREIPMALTVPVVMAERVTDLIALLILMSSGLLVFRLGALPMAILGACVLLFLLIVSYRPLALSLLRLAGKLPGVGRFSDRLLAFYESMATLFRPRPLAIATLLSVASWSCECLGTYLIVGGFPSVRISLLMATFIYSAGTVGGLPTPGGLGLTDGGMTAMLHYLAHIERSVAAAATLLVRLTTLWFAVIVGVIALLVFSRRVELAEDATDGMQRGD